MQLMALNALLLFDAIFIFFLFLVSVSCLLYYLPLVPPSRSSRSSNSEDDADLESALVMEASREQEEDEEVDSNHYPCSGGQSIVYPHYCHHHHTHTAPTATRESTYDMEQGEEVEVDVERDPYPTAISSPLHQLQNLQNRLPNVITPPQLPPPPPTSSQGQHQQQPDHPATHIIMNPQGYYGSSRRERGKPLAKVETV